MLDHSLVLRRSKQAIIKAMMDGNVRWVVSIVSFVINAHAIGNWIRMETERAIRTHLPIFFGGAASKGCCDLFSGPVHADSTDEFRRAVLVANLDDFKVCQRSFSRLDIAFHFETIFFLNRIKGVEMQLGPVFADLVLDGCSVLGHKWHNVG
jgi:hypothetical protein